MAALKLLQFPTREARVADVLCEAAMLGADDVIVVAACGSEVEVLSSATDRVLALGMLRIAEHALLTE